MNNAWDVIVVGARVAGAATAMLLARAGLRVLCIDRGHYGGDTVSTHALMRGGVMLLQEWGLLAELVRAGTPAVRRTVFHYEEETVAISIKPSAGVEALYAPRRSLLDRLLVDAAERAGATVRFGTTLHAVERDARGRVIGVVLSDRDGTESVLRARLVVGADGRNSTLAGLVGAERTDGAEAGSFLYGYWANLPSDGYEWFYRPGVAAGAIPTNAGLTCVFVATRSARLDRAVATHSALTTFEQLSGSVGLGDRIATADRVGGVRHVRNLPPGYRRRAFGPGWALVGDAGLWMDPMSTHGITSALRDAAMLAHAVTGSANDQDRQPALARFEADRDRLSAPMAATSEEIATFAWDMTRIRTLVRTLSSAMTYEVELLSDLRTSGPLSSTPPSAA